jgi:hypothetical protein
MYEDNKAEAERGTHGRYILANIYVDNMYVVVDVGIHSGQYVCYVESYICMLC